MTSRANIMLRDGEASPVLELVAGSGQGKIYDLARERMSIGRAEDNDIVLPSESVSRYHAVLERLDDGAWKIRDNQSKNGVQINGQSVEEQELNPGDLMQLGAFTFRYGGAAMGQPLQPDQDFSPQLESPQEPEPYEQQQYEVALPTPAKPNRRILIYVTALVMLLGYYYLKNGNEPDKKPDTADGKTDEKAAVATKLARDFKTADEPDLKSTPDTNKMVGIEDPTLKRAETEMEEVEKRDGVTSSLKEAEQFFRKGQRDYLSQNYGRAIEAFQTALSLYRGHELAKKYLGLAIYEAETSAKEHMEMGVKYFESLQYSRAIYDFTEVINLMAHRPTEPIVKEAESYILIAKKKLRAAELYP